MTFVQAGFCCDAYQKNTTVVVIIVIIKRNLAMFIQYRDNFHHQNELNAVMNLSQLNF
jgi:hypothetical protein